MIVAVGVKERSSSRPTLYSERINQARALRKGWGTLSFVKDKRRGRKGGPPVQHVTISMKGSRQGLPYAPSEQTKDSRLLDSYLVDWRTRWVVVCVAIVLRGNRMRPYAERRGCEAG